MSESKESGQAGREARDAVIGRPRGAKSAAIGAAMRRYLSAATYDELRRKKAESDDDSTPHDTQQ
jgi:hypothetical protein